MRERFICEQINPKFLEVGMRERGNVGADLTGLLCTPQDVCDLDRHEVRRKQPPAGKDFLGPLSLSA